MKYQSKTDVAARIEELRKLKKGWLDGKGDKIRAGSLHYAQVLAERLVQTRECEQLGIFPTERGCVQIEGLWPSSDLHFEVWCCPDGMYEVDAEHTELDASACDSFDDVDDVLEYLNTVNEELEDDGFRGFVVIG